MHIEDTQRLVTEIEMLKVVLYCIKQEQKAVVAILVKKTGLTAR